MADPRSVSPSAYVREAAERFGISAPARPTNPGTKMAEVLQKLLEDSVAALRQATDPWDYPSGTAPAVDVAAVALQLANVVLDAFGTAATYGIDLDPVVAEVHRSILTQRRADAGGNVRRGTGYSEPDVAAVLAAQHDGTDPSDRGWWADQALEALVPAGEAFDPEMPARWLDTPHAQLEGYTPWTAITNGAGALIWRSLPALCDTRVARGA